LSSDALSISLTGGPSDVEQTSEERVAVRKAAGKLFQMTGPATMKLLIPRRDPEASTGRPLGNISANSTHQPYALHRD